MVRLENVKKIYNQNKANAFMALKGVSMIIRDGELVAIVGKSGAGKSTLLHILACIDNYEEGEYSLDTTLVKDLSEKELAVIRNEKIGLVMQDYALVEDFTALENVMLPLDFAVGKTRKNKMERKQMAKSALEAVDMWEFADKPVSNMSGGQKQRVAIARAIVNQPTIILADEPTGALDSVNADAIMGVFEKLNAEGKTVIIVTHDKEVAERCDRIIEIYDGKLRG